MAEKYAGLGNEHASEVAWLLLSRIQLSFGCDGESKRWQAKDLFMKSTRNQSVQMYDKRQVFRMLVLSVLTCLTCVFGGLSMLVLPPNKACDVTTVAAIEVNPLNGNTRRVRLTCHSRRHGSLCHVRLMQREPVRNHGDWVGGKPIVSLCVAYDKDDQRIVTEPTVIEIVDDASLTKSLSNLQANITLRLHPGDYHGERHVAGVSHLTIEAIDPLRPPVFVAGRQALHFSRCDHLTLKNLKVVGQSINGINIDDGGQMDKPTTDVLIQRVEVIETGPNGNHDAIKLSGLKNVRIVECKISGWGGQAIDFVGCHQSQVQRCQIFGKKGFSQNSGIQCKGGSADITIENCYLKDAGPRPLNVGGSTDLDYFRPQGAKYEASRIVVQGNMINGGQCACAFVGVDQAKFIGNRINYPEKWIFRVLQENVADGFIPCRNVSIQDNFITFNRETIRTAVNIGPGTLPDSFSFQGNRWFAEDEPSKSKPNLPVKEIQPTYGQDPREIR